MIIPYLIENSARMFPKRKALIFEDTPFTYKNLNETINRHARYLIKEYNINKDDTVGILLNNSPEYVIYAFAIIKTGATLVPINNFLTSREIGYIVDDCRISYLVSSSEFESHFEKLLKKCDKLKKILSINNTYTHLQIDNPDINKKLSGENISVNIDENDTAVIIYTSGTTGYPKGAMLSHKNLVSNSTTCAEEINVSKKDRLLLFLPMFHSFTFTVCMLLPLTKGACIVALPSVKPFSRVLKKILLNRVSIFVGIPKIYDILSEKKIPFWLKPLIKLRVCISGSAPLSAETITQFNKNVRLTLIEGYGLSEASPVVSLNPLYGIQKTGSVGLPIANVKIRIVDENMRDLPQGEVGEIAVQGDNVMLGYYNKPVDTKETIRDNWLLTGDLGKIDEDGYLYIVDRKKNMILVQGMNVYPREIEEIIISHPAVEEIAVIGINDKNRGEIPIAFVVKKMGYDLKSKEISTYCRERLALYKCPRKINFLDKLPRSATGKILKKDLLKQQSS